MFSFRSHYCDANTIILRMFDFVIISNASFASLKSASVIDDFIDIFDAQVH